MSNSEKIQVFFDISPIKSKQAMKKETFLSELPSFFMYCFVPEEMQNIMELFVL